MKVKNTTATYNKIWLNLTNNFGGFNQILIGYVPGATNNDDGLAYDINKYPKGLTSIYSLIPSEGSKKYSVQGKKINRLSKTEVIPLGFICADASLDYQIALDHFEGDFLNSNSIYLKDHLENKIHDLKSGAYTFNATQGAFNDRFQVIFEDSRLSVIDNELDLNALQIISLENNQVQFNTATNQTIKTIKIFDLVGIQLYHLEGDSNSEIYDLPRLSVVFIAKVALSNGNIITKKGIKNN
ncbi:hypothetical protein [Pseudotamlana carrageenivorans]|uniref:Uncharacterized protein n=1 Tax=Pseudotamlana carrageenivorans TaxID=2069432 RepID=A0A2I7SHM2_9FLAO|nr:hypothetical protein [Tamlana carrageenivorans]AUS05396.1 hypothetical protein C1A40_07870 [Tamlana carrageenivorans]